MQLDTGSRLGPYEILAPIGSGGMGEVYRARDTRLEREVAVKILSRRLERDPDAITRFEREAKSVAALSHPNIVAIHDFAVEAGLPYTVTELLDGESLRERLLRGPLPWREAAELGVAIADGLSAAHAKGIVHRDLKPENLFVTREGRLKILDFGLARPAHEAWASARPYDPAAPTIATPSDSGVVLGTVGYMSPEQARGLPLGTTSDIFSLGCVLYEMVTGRRAFDRATATDTLVAVLNDPPGPVSESGRQVPPELSRVILHCLEKEPTRRFQSARDTAFALQAVLNDSSIQPTPGRRGGPRARSVAVLPFTNERGDPDLDYLCDGLTESLINALTQVPRLRVLSRAVVFRYKGRPVDPTTVGVELNATTLVTGRVLAHGGMLHVNAEMIDVATDAQLWGQRFVRPATDLFAMQEELGQEIGGALRGRLSRAATRRAPSAHKPAPGAYEHFLRGRHHYNRWSAEAFAKAIEHFESAITEDPAFAQAWAGLAESLGAAGYFGFLPAADAMPRAKTAAERAIRLDDASADGHAALGLGLLFWDWDFAAAGQAFRRAIACNPRHPLARVYHSLYLSSQGRLEEALAEAREAEKLDPVSWIPLFSVAWALHFDGRHEDAITQLYRILDLDGGSANAHGMILGTRELQRDYASALRHAEPWLQAMGLPQTTGEELRRAWEGDGEQGYWRARLRLVEQGANCGGPQAQALADIYVHLGDHAAALTQLERVVDEHLGAAVFLGVEPSFRPLRGDPRFGALLERVGLPAMDR